MTLNSYFTLNSGLLVGVKYISLSRSGVRKGDVMESQKPYTVYTHMTMPRLCRDVTENMIFARGLCMYYTAREVNIVFTLLAGHLTTYYRRHNNSTPLASLSSLTRMHHAAIEYAAATV